MKCVRQECLYTELFNKCELPLPSFFSFRDLVNILIHLITDYIQLSRRQRDRVRLRSNYSLRNKKTKDYISFGKAHWAILIWLHLSDPWSHS